MPPRSYRIVVRAAMVVWGIVTCVALVTIIQAPSDHVDLALGLVLIWIALIAFAAFSRLTESLGRKRR